MNTDGVSIRDGSLSRAPVVAAAVVSIVGTATLLPFVAVQLKPSSAFMPALIAAVAVFDIMSAYLLVGDFRDRGDRRALVMAWAYVWSLVVMTGYALAFPGAIFADPPLALTASTSPYLYVAWHGGFPVLLGIAWAPWPTRFSSPVAPSERLRASLACLVTAGVVGGGTVALFCLYAEQLPVLINGLDLSRMTTLTAPLVVPLVVVALAATVHGTWGRTGPERWASIAVLVCLCDLILTYVGRTRYSLGWYGGRSLTLVAAGVVLVAMLASFRRLKAQAERDAHIDALTGLVNRRGAYAALETMLAQCQRSGTRVGVVSFDLDWFKAINDKEGHEAGDAVLAQVGVVLNSRTRGGDVGARVGGEEFLLLLHDNEADDLLAAAERVREAIAEMTVPEVCASVTASMGVTTMGPEDHDVASVLRRADQALYAAKHNGRNRVEACLLDTVALAGARA